MYPAGMLLVRKCATLAAGLMIVTMASYLATASAKVHAESFFKACPRNDSDCLKESIETIIKHIRHGSIELNMKSIDPLAIPAIEIDENSDENFTLGLSLSNTQLFGASDADIRAVRSNLLDNKLELTVKYPRLEVTGEFHSEGAVLAFPLASYGRYVINMTDVTSSCIIYMKELHVNDTSGAAVEGVDLDVLPTAVTYVFGDSLDGDDNLGSAMNEFLNDNSQEVFRMMKQKTMKVFEKAFKDLANSFLANFPAEALFED